MSTKKASPYGSVMSCQSLTRTYAEEKELPGCGSFHRTVRFNSGSRSSGRKERDGQGPSSLSTSLVCGGGGERAPSAMSQSAPAPASLYDACDAPPQPACRFPKLEECAHFHYERVALGGLSIEVTSDADTACDAHAQDNVLEEGWVTLRVRTHVNSVAVEPAAAEPRTLSVSWSEPSDVREWTLNRNAQHFLQIDDMLHRCIYDRKVSGLVNLSAHISASLMRDRAAYTSLVSHYAHHLSMIADDSINCGPVLNWLQCDNKGHKLLVANEDSSSINTPAVAAGYSVRKYTSRARDEISFDVGDMISIIDMPGPQESEWWRGKRGFRVGFFPRHCVAVIGDKVPRHMTQPPPIVGSVAVSPIKPVLRKHGKLISLFRSFILSRPSRRSLKQQGILRERVFGCDLGEHLLNCGHDVPQVLVSCATHIESVGAVDGIYRLSGGAALTQRLRARYDTSPPPAGNTVSAAVAPLDATDHLVLVSCATHIESVGAVDGIYRLSGGAALTQRLRARYDTSPPPAGNTVSAAVAPLDATDHLVLVSCATHIESVGAVDGIYRLSGGAALTQRLRARYDTSPPPAGNTVSAAVAPLDATDPHAVASLLKMYFRELPNPLCTYQLYDSFVAAVQPGQDEATRLANMKATVAKLPPPHYRTLAYLMRHLRRVSLLAAATGMTARNMAIVWAPNLLRCAAPHHALHGVAVQAVVTEFLICYAEELFAEDQTQDSLAYSSCDADVELRRSDSQSRPKSLPLSTHTKLLSLEEARRRGKSVMVPASITPQLTTPSSLASVSLRPSTSLTPNYIEVGSGPNNLPQYHTVLDFPTTGKRGLKRSTSGWRGFFSRSKLQRPRAPPSEQPPPPPQQESPVSITLRPVKSCESLHSEKDTVPPLAAAQRSTPLKHHTRSASCDSYFEPWQMELADMRLRLSPQERDHNIFSEEDDTGLLNVGGGQAGSQCSTPAASELCSVEASPCKNVGPPDFSERKRNIIEEALSQIGYIDGGQSPGGAARARGGGVGAEKRGGGGAAAHEPKRLCKDRDSPISSLSDFQSSTINVKLRERNSPRKAKSNRYSGLYIPATDDKPDKSAITTDKPAIKAKPVINSRLSWHGKDHSTLIKVDWPCEINSVNNLTNSSLNTPSTPSYGVLESDSEASENKQTIKVSQDTCHNCLKEKCLKCELNATDFGLKTDFKVGEPVTSMRRVSVENLDLHDSLEGAVSNNVDGSLNVSNVSEKNDTKNYKSDYNLTDRSEDNLTDTLGSVDNIVDSSNENICDRTQLDDRMTSSHESSSGYSNNEDTYENYKYIRPNYINLNSSSTKSTPNISPLKSPLKSTISITFRTPTKEQNPEYELLSETPTYDTDQAKNKLTVVEMAQIPLADASLPTQEACQPANDDRDDKMSVSESGKFSIDTKTGSMSHCQIIDDRCQLKGSGNDFVKELSLIQDFLTGDPLKDIDLPNLQISNYDDSLELNLDVKNDEFDEFNLNKDTKESPKDLIILESNEPKDIDVYSQVKFFKRSIDEVNAMLEAPEVIERHYENVAYPDVSNSPKKIDDSHQDYENIDIEAVRLAIKPPKTIDSPTSDVPTLPDLIQSQSKKNLKVRELANKFESPTEPKVVNFDKYIKAEIKPSTVDKKTDDTSLKIDTKTKATTNPINLGKLTKSSLNTRSLDENAFAQEFGVTQLEFDSQKPDIMAQSLTENDAETQNLDAETKNLYAETKKETENKKPLIPTTKPIIDTNKPIVETDTLRRLRIEKYKEERRNFLREKYSSQSFRSNPEHLTRIKLKKDSEENKQNESNILGVETPCFERRNTMELCQRANFSLAKSADALDELSPSRERVFSGLSKESSSKTGKKSDGKGKKVLPAYKIKDMTAMFEQISQNNI